MHLLILLLLPLLATSINLPRLDPCQIDNTQCNMSDFTIGDETTCHTTSDAELGWGIKKCTAFVSYCSDIQDMGYEQEYNRIRCDSDEAPAADPTAHVGSNEEMVCKEWKRMEYCQWNWVNMGVALVFAGVVGIGSILVCTKKGITQQKEEEKEELLEEARKASDLKTKAMGRTNTDKSTIKF